MKTNFRLLAVLVVSTGLTFTACEKKEMVNAQIVNELDVSEGDSQILLKSKGDSSEVLEKLITNPITKLEDCKYIVSGTVEYKQGDDVIGIIDYGDGTCDNIATKTIDGVTTEFSLDYDKKDYDKENYDKQDC